MNSVRRFVEWSPAGFKPPQSAAACRNRPGPASSGQGSSVADGRCTTSLHKTHGTAISGETTVVYGWHPWSGRVIRLHEVIERATGASARCSLVDVFVVRVQELPVWMLDATVCRATHPATEPVAALGALTALAGLLREAARHTTADAVPNVGVASPESQGERRAATAPSSAPEAASTIGTALGGYAGASGCSAAMEQPAGSDPPGADQPSDTTDGGPRRQRRSAAERGSEGRRR